MIVLDGNWVGPYGASALELKPGTYTVRVVIVGVASNPVEIRIVSEAQSR